METVIVSVICIALILFGGMTISQGFINSVDASTSGLGEIGERTEIIMRTGLTALSASLPRPDTLEVILENSGQVKLADFAKWDVIVQYYDSTGNYQVSWLPYTASGLADNRWEIAWIRLDGGNEVFDPDILNPKEEMLIRAQLNPPVGANTTNMVVVSTPSGITAHAYFTP
ncbi:MAG: hypothetical protein N2506_06490 [Dehalococcoidales bacterium]|nr:hypothetical protein [Dehalococcoidales bacterium]